MNNKFASRLVLFMLIVFVLVGGFFAQMAERKHEEQLLVAHEIGKNKGFDIGYKEGRKSALDMAYNFLFDATVAVRNAPCTGDITEKTIVVLMPPAASLIEICSDFALLQSNLVLVEGCWDGPLIKIEPSGKGECIIKDNTIISE